MPRSVISTGYGLLFLTPKTIVLDDTDQYAGVPVVVIVVCPVAVTRAPQIINNNIPRLSNALFIKN